MEHGRLPLVDQLAYSGSHILRKSDKQEWPRPHTLWGEAEGIIWIKEAEAEGRGVGGELVCVFISLKGFTRDEELTLLCGAPKGGSAGAAIVKANHYWTPGRVF